MLSARLNLVRDLSYYLKKTIFFTVKSPTAARRITDLLIQAEHDSIVLPFADFPGPMSKEIMSRKFGALTICERDQCKFNTLQSYIREFYPNKNIFTHQEDLFDLSYRDYSHESQRICSQIIMENLMGASSSTVHEICDSNVKFLVPLLKSRNEAGFLKNIYNQMCLKIGLCSTVYLNYYFLLSDRQYTYLNAKPSQNLLHYRSSTVLYNSLFDITRLESFDLCDTFQIPLKDIQQTSRDKDSSYKQVHLVLLKPKLQLLKNVDSKTLLEYRFFVTQMMGKRKALVINFIDRWFDGCARDMSQFGINSNTIAGDLDVNQYLTLFMYIKNKSEYSSSTFLSAASQSEVHLC